MWDEGEDPTTDWPGLNKIVQTGLWEVNNSIFQLD